MALTITERDAYNLTCPFYINDERYGVVKIIQVSRKHFITEEGINCKIENNYKMFATLEDLDYYALKRIAEEAKIFFKANQEKFDYFSKFRDVNPELFI